MEKKVIRVMNALCQHKDAVEVVDLEVEEDVDEDEDVAVGQ